MTVNQIKHKKSGIYYPENNNSGVIKDAYFLKDYGGLPTKIDFKNKIVMDCGANIGCFSLRALQEGAKIVHCYEPHPTCVESLRLNLANFRNIVIKRKVVVGDNYKGKTLDLYCRDDRLEASSLNRKSSRFGYLTIKVKAVNFWNELELIKPQILKMDIEGEEWNILNRELPSFVEVFLIELHGHSKSEVNKLIEMTFPNSAQLSSSTKKIFGVDWLYTAVQSRQ